MKKHTATHVRNVKLDHINRKKACLNASHAEMVHSKRQLVKHNARNAVRVATVLQKRLEPVMVGLHRVQLEHLMV